MVKNRALAKAISDAGWSEFRRMVVYKAVWHGRTEVTVDHVPREEPDADPLRPGMVCGTMHDHDRNAAVNLLAEGLRILAG